MNPRFLIALALTGAMLALCATEAPPLPPGAERQIGKPAAPAVQQTHPLMGMSPVEFWTRMATNPSSLNLPFPPDAAMKRLAAKVAHSLPALPPRAPRPHAVKKSAAKVSSPVRKIQATRMDATSSNLSAKPGETTNAPPSKRVGLRVTASRPIASDSMQPVQRMATILPPPPFVIRSITKTTNAVALTFQCAGTNTYAIERAVKPSGPWQTALIGSGRDGSVLTPVDTRATNATGFYRARRSSRPTLGHDGIVGNPLVTAQGIGCFWVDNSPTPYAPPRFNFKVVTNGVTRSTVLWDDDSRTSYNEMCFDPRRQEITQFKLPAFRPYGDNYSKTYLKTVKLTGFPNSLQVASIVTNFTWAATTEYDQYLAPIACQMSLDGSNVVAAGFDFQTKADTNNNPFIQYYFYLRRSDGVVNPALVVNLDSWWIASQRPTMAQSHDKTWWLFRQTDSINHIDAITLTVAGSGATEHLVVKKIYYGLMSCNGENEDPVAISGCISDACTDDVLLAVDVQPSIWGHCTDPSTCYPLYIDKTALYHVHPDGTFTSDVLPAWQPRLVGSVIAKNGTRLRGLWTWEDEIGHWDSGAFVWNEPYPTVRQYEATKQADGSWSFAQCADEAWQVLSDGSAFVGPAADGQVTIY